MGKYAEILDRIRADSVNTGKYTMHREGPNAEINPDACSILVDSSRQLLEIFPRRQTKQLSDVQPLGVIIVWMLLRHYRKGWDVW